MTVTVTTTMRGDEWIAKAIPAMNRAVEAMAFEGSLQAQAILKPANVASSPWSPPHARHGNAGLRGSVTHASPDQLGTPLKGGFGTGLAYGRHLEFGAVIKPKTKKLLVIPLNFKAGRLMVQAGNSARLALIAMRFLYPGQVARIPSKKGGILVGVKPKRKGSKVTEGFLDSAPLFLLSSRAVIKPRPWLLRAALQGKEAIKAAGVARAGVELRKAGLVA